MSKQSFDNGSSAGEAYNESNILVQVQVMQGLELENEMDYVTQGYAEECSHLMQNNGDVRAFLDHDDIDSAAELLLSLLKEWKNKQNQRLAA